MKVMNGMCAMPSPPPPGDDGQRLNSRGLTWESVMSRGYEGEDGDDADADEEDEPSRADDGSTQNVED